MAILSARLQLTPYLFPDGERRRLRPGRGPSPGRRRLAGRGQGTGRRGGTTRGIPQQGGTWSGSPSGERRCPPPTPPRGLPAEFARRQRLEGINSGRGGLGWEGTDGGAPWKVPFRCECAPPSPLPWLFGCSRGGLNMHFFSPPLRLRLSRSPGRVGLSERSGQRSRQQISGVEIRG